jgi:aerobic-type carbon monoxide dehydrogenase small subunit (CoxS/CutS family)
MEIDLTVNERQVTVTTNATTPLPDVLRNHLDLKASPTAADWNSAAPAWS